MLLIIQNYQNLQMEPKLRVANILNDIYKWLLLNKHLKKLFLMSLVLITGSCGLVGSGSVLFFSKKGFINRCR